MHTYAACLNVGMGLNTKLPYYVFLASQPSAPKTLGLERPGKHQKSTPAYPPNHPAHEKYRF